MKKELQQSQSLNETILAYNKVNKFLKECIKILGYGFHPDHSFYDYIDSNDNKTYTEKKAKALDKKMDKMFELCNQYDFDIYGLSIDILDANK